MVGQEHLGSHEGCSRSPVDDCGGWLRQTALAARREPVCAKLAVRCQRGVRERVALRTATALAIALLSGCVSMYMDKYLMPLVGQNIHAAVAKLGYPDSQRTMLGDTIYVWERSHHGVMVLPTVTTTTGNVAGEPVALNTQGSEAVPTHQQCKIQMAVDTNGTIKTYQWVGNDTGCAPYLQALLKH
jgi:hypothetical protein